MGRKPNPNPEPTLRSDGRYMLWPRTPQGKRHTSPAYGRTPHECRMEKERIERELTDAQSVRQAISERFEPGSFAEFVYETYCPRTYDGARLKTKITYDAELRLHILPVLGHRQIARIGYDDVLELKASLRRHTRKGERTSEPLSDSKTREVLMRTREILGLSNKLRQAKGLPTREDWKLVKAPRKGKKVREEPPEDFATKLLAHAAKTGYAYMCGPLFCGLYLGLRLGEVCALKWNDIDRQKLTIRVDEQRQYLGSSFGTQENAPKSQESVRTIGVTEELLAWIDKMRSKNSVYVFTNTRKKPVSPNKLSQMTPVLCEGAGLPRTTFHDLRSHTASNLAALGYDLYTIASILGHTKVDTTMIYLNSRKGAQRKALAALLKSLEEREQVEKEVDEDDRLSA
jgi:integrase